MSTDSIFGHNYILLLKRHPLCLPLHVLVPRTAAIHRWTKWACKIKIKQTKTETQKRLNLTYASTKYKKPCKKTHNPKSNSVWEKNKWIYNQNKTKNTRKGVAFENVTRGRNDERRLECAAGWYSRNDELELAAAGERECDVRTAAALASDINTTHERRRRRHGRRVGISSGPALCARPHDTLPPPPPPNTQTTTTTILTTTAIPQPRFHGV